MTKDERFMQRAIELAEKGKGRVEPNPMVGALVVKDGQVVGEGYHECFGGPHAEVKALEEAGEGARGASLYVNLEPCAHYGKTPPCVEALIGAGVRRVVLAVMDPNPLTVGKGLQRLKQAGIEVLCGVLEEEAMSLNAPFFKLMTVGMPYVIAKWAMSLDGKTATRTGDSRWVSSEESRQYVHRLRSQVDAVMVGIGTVLRDDPLLTSRVEGGRNPRRVVVDGQARLPLDSKLVKTVNEAEVIVATTALAPRERLEGLERVGCKLLVAKGKERRVDLIDLMKKLGEMQFTNILLEGGGTLTASFFEEGLVDRVVIFMAPKIFGGGEASALGGPVTGVGVDRVEEAFRLKDIRVSRLSEDILVEAIVEKDSREGGK